MGDEYYYDKFVPEFARLQKKEVWRMVARKDNVLRKHGINTKIFLWKVSPEILAEIIEECRK